MDKRGRKRRREAGEQWEGLDGRNPLTLALEARHRRAAPHRGKPAPDGPSRRRPLGLGRRCLHNRLPTRRYPRQAGRRRG